MIKRIIFDIDETLLKWNNSVQNELFRRRFSKEDAEKLVKCAEKLINQYELSHEQYDIDAFAKYLTEKTGVLFGYDDVVAWIDAYDNAEAEIVPYVVEALEYLKNKGYSLVALTNWFGKTQKVRLKRMGLLKYFEEVYAGDVAIKPSENSYKQAAGKFRNDECVLIGDSYEKDYLGAKKFGMQAILYDPMERHLEVDSRISDMRKLKEMF